MSTPKEPHFFDPVEATMAASHTLSRVSREEDYLGLFRNADARFLGESSTTYWWHADTTARRIAAFSPDAQVLILLRDPVTRAYSHYLNDCRDSIESRPFSATLPIDRPGSDVLLWGHPLLRVELGFYADRLRRYRDTFGANLSVLVFEEYAADPAGQVSEVARILGVPEQADDLQMDDSSAGSNRHRVPRGMIARGAIRSPKVRRVARALLPSRVRGRAYESLLKQASVPPMEAHDRRALSDLYAEDTREVEELLERPLPWLSSESRAHI
jgi:hypothetical protein